MFDYYLLHKYRLLLQHTKKCEYNMQPKYEVALEAHGPGLCYLNFNYKHLSSIKDHIFMTCVSK